MTTFEELCEYMEALPENRQEVYYRTEMAKFICEKIDEIKNNQASDKEANQ